MHFILIIIGVSITWTSNHFSLGYLLGIDYYTALKTYVVLKEY
jgi:hypothetical protein